MNDLNIPGLADTNSFRAAGRSRRSGLPVGTGTCVFSDETANVRVVADPGPGTAFDAGIAEEPGRDAVRTNTAIAGAKDAVLMARATSTAPEAGRETRLTGRVPRRACACASSPLDGALFS